MKLSLVLPVYNRYGYMRRVLHSLARQTLPPDEVLVVDDGSTDGDVRELFDGFPTLNVRGFRLERGEGYRNSSRPYNVGIRQATGDVVVYCAAELVHFPTNFEIIRQEFEKDANIFLIGGSVFFQYEKCVIPEAVWAAPEQVLSLPYDTWHKDYYATDESLMLIYDADAAVHAVRRRWLEMVRGFDEELGTAWGHNDQEMRRRMTTLLGLPEVRRPDVMTIHPWHARPPAENMARSDAERAAAEQLGLVVNLNREWGALE